MTESSLQGLTATLADRYRIDRELGQGGMATVFLAHDLRHDRKVAIKELRPELAAVIGASRFLAEIKVTANLQHPHILSLHDSGEVNGTVFYVMPYVEGESLRDRLNREKQLPIAEAVRIATEVASALEYAHRHGVIHRDIKPENILLHDGSALVADFGIALAATSAGSRMTETGMSLGTPTYMSPEQAMGERTLDARTDVYALGCVLYEMLTGEPPFTGPTAQSIVAKVMTEKPAPPTAARDTIPDVVEEAVLAALAKLPADRPASAAQFAATLAGGTGHRTDVKRRTPSVRPTARRSALLGGALVMTTALAAWGWLRPRSGDGTQVNRHQIVLWKHSIPSPLHPGTYLVGTQATIAPDGSSIVFSDSTDSGWLLWRKRRDAAFPEPIAGTEGGVSPFFSPDGKWVGYFTMEGRVRKVSVDGGGSITLAENGDPEYKAAAWLDDDTIVYSEELGRFSRVPASGGTPVTFAIKGPAEADGPAISPLPGSRGFLMTGCNGNCAIWSAVLVVDLATDSVKLLVPDAAGAWYSPTGHLLYTSREGGLFAAPFDLERMEVTGGAVPVLDDVEPTRFLLSASGTALYAVDATSEVPSELVWVTRDGKAEPVDSGWRGRFDYPAVSPDGRSVAVSLRGTSTDLWIHRDDGTRQKILSDAVATWRPEWTADGTSLAFVGIRDPKQSAQTSTPYIVRADGVGAARPILSWSWGVWEVELSRDGDWVVIRSDEEGANPNVRARRLRGDTTMVPLLTDPFNTTNIALSPDARWLAYTSNESGRQREVYVASFPDMQLKRLVSRGGGNMPRWAWSGRELFFHSGGFLMAVDVPPGPTFTPGTPRPLFSIAGFRVARNRQQYDVAPGDQRFVMIRESGTAASRLVYAENWRSELRAKLKD